MSDMSAQPFARLERRSLLKKVRQDLSLLSAACEGSAPSCEWLSLWKKWLQLALGMSDARPGAKSTNEVRQLIQDSVFA